ncbi:MAG: aspartate aminotransferase family protein [Rhodobacteraceae bacterium]|nr:aspartate aminotransferase family protein [Paracoccaceae bacterium]
MNHLDPTASPARDAAQALEARRRRLLGPGVPTFYREPLHIVRGEGVWLWDAGGQRYLDCYNNVPHVGHCHPRVVAAIAEQAARLNTHTRYLHEGILDYAERLVALFGHDLKNVAMVCTGSEANDMALRMAQAVTGRTGLIATDNTYHGNTAAVSQLSARKPPIGGYPAHVRLVPSPESLCPDSIEVQAARFTAGVERAISELEAEGHGLAGMILCPFLANEGFPEVPRGFFSGAAAAVRRAGGLIVADEVQPGFGRLGRVMWGHEAVDLTPDVVTLGKPMGNGHPVAATVTRPEIMAAFREAFSYFNTFGGNPVSCAAAMAVLDVLEDEGLMANAETAGAHARRLMGAIRHPMLAEVRGAGLFFGAEFVDPETDAPAPDFVIELVEAMKARGVLLNRIGRHGNTLKIRPPMPFSVAEADMLADRLQDALDSLPLPA